MARYSALFASIALLSSCATNEEIGKLEQALAHDGPWDIPDETIAAGDPQYVPYTGAGPWIGGEGCTDGLTAGANALRDWLPQAFPQISLIGGYNCRAIVGDDSQMSVHAVGRALDVHIPMSDGDADNDLGDPVGNWLIEHSEEIGIQYIIWDHWTWGAAREPGSKERLYGGTNPHIDHLHVELSVDAANMATPWFSGSQELPSAGDCPSIPAEGGVVEETGSCFAAFGPSAYWRSESVGHEGSLIWTNAWESDRPSNWARWQLHFSQAGSYAVEVWAEPGFAVHHATRYGVRHAGQDHELVVDLSSGAEWIRLGSFDFEAGADQHVSVYDNSSSAVDVDQHIAADAIRLVPVDPVGVEPIPGPSTMEMGPAPEPEPPAPIEGGDPKLDDDPPVRHTLTSGCTAAPGSRGGAPWMLFLLGGLALLRRSK